MVEFINWFWWGCLFLAWVVVLAVGMIHGRSHARILRDLEAERGDLVGFNLRLSEQVASLREGMRKAQAVKPAVIDPQGREVKPRTLSFCKQTGVVCEVRL